MAVGEKSSRRASSVSGSSTWSTSSAGHRLPKHVLDAIEQVALVRGFFARAWLELFFRQRFRELFEQLPLILRQLFRSLHLHRREQIAAAAAVDVRHSLAAE